MKKILYLLTKSNYGGAQKYTFELASYAHDLNHSVVVAAGGTGEKDSNPGLLAEKLTNEHIRFVYIRNFMRDVSLWSDVKAFFEIAARIRSEKPDVIHLSSSKAASLGALAGKLLRIKKIIYTVHGLPHAESWRPAWQRHLIRLMTRATIKLSDVIITINSEDTKVAKSMTKHPGKINKIPNGIDTFKTLPKHDALTLIGLDLPENALVIGGIGELHPNKNWSTLLHVLTTLPERTHIVIIGTGENEGVLKNTISQLGLSHRVHLTGYQKNAHKLLSIFDIFVLPSKKEGLPYVLLEAGIAGIAVVSADLPGTRDIIDTGTSGLLVKPDKTNLSTALHILLRDDNMKRQIAHNLHEHVVSNFSLNASLQKTIATYDSSKSESTDRIEA